MHVVLRRRIAAVAVVGLAAAGVVAGGGAGGAVAARAAGPAGYSPPPGVSYACPQSAGPGATCAGLSDSLVSTATSPPAGLDPADIRTAYAIPASTASSGETVAVVGAYDYIHAAADLSAYRSGFGIPACTTASGCFQVADVTSGNLQPSAGWDVAEAQAMDMISAVCPSCHILLVQAQTTGIADTDGLGAAENEAVALGATFIVDPWAVPEASVGTNEPSYDAEYFDHPGVAITVSGLDTGYTGAVSYPAASPDVIAVGGTTLTAASGSRGYTETTWDGTQSGCSAYEAAKPAWQTDTACLGRSLNDVAAVADPADSIVYYDSDYNSAGWGTGGGTTYAAGIVAALYALDGHPAPGSNPASYLYDHPAALWDIGTGSTGTCAVTVLCDAGPGWDGPTGMGTPFGINAFHTTGAKPVTVTAVNGTTWAFATGTDGTIQAASLPSGSTTWSALTSLGGDWPSYPAAIATSDGSVWVFAIDGSVAGGNLWADQLPSGSGTWSGWTEIGNPGVNVLGTPTVLQDKTGQLDLFARSAGKGNLWETTLPSSGGSWSAFTNLFGNLPYDVSGVVGGGGWIYLMGVGNNSSLYYDELAPGGSWTGWTLIGGKIVTGVPAIIQDAGGNDHVFVREVSDGAILTSVLPSGSAPPWPALSSLGGSVLTDPVAWGGRGGTNFLYVIGTGSGMFYDKESGTTWSGYVQIGNGYTGVPGVVQDNGGVYHLVTRTTSGELAAFLLTGNPTQPPPVLLGGSLAGS